jgi:hypothetical protein
MNSEDTSSENLPAVITDDGFDNTDIDDRLIKGTILRAVDGVWSTRDGTDLPSVLIALSTTKAAQHWQDQKPIKTIVKEPGRRLPDVEELNAKIPKKKWETGLDGEPRAPWVIQHIVYLLDPRDASVFTYLNSTAGARSAVRELMDKVAMMRKLRNANVVPLIELSAKSMPTKFGTKLRPFFKVVDWRDLSGEPQAAITSPTRPMLDVGASVKPVSLKEEMADEIPWDDGVPSFGDDAA